MEHDISEPYVPPSDTEVSIVCSYKDLMYDMLYTL